MKIMISPRKIPVDTIPKAGHRPYTIPHKTSMIS